MPTEHRTMTPARRWLMGGEGGGRADERGKEEKGDERA